MDRLTNEQRLQIIELYYQNSCSVRNVHRALLPFYGRHSRPSEQSIRKIVTKFRTKFTLLDIKPPTRLRTVRSEDAIAAVEQSIEENPNKSIRHRAQQLEMCPSTLWKILRKDLDTEGEREGRTKKRESEGVEAPAKSTPKKGVVSNSNDTAVPAKRGRKHVPKPVPSRGRGRPPSKAGSKKKETSDEEDEEDDEKEEKKKESSGEADSS